MLGGYVSVALLLIACQSAAPAPAPTPQPTAPPTATRPAAPPATTAPASPSPVAAATATVDPVVAATFEAYMFGRPRGPIPTSGAGAAVAPATATSTPQGFFGSFLGPDPTAQAGTTAAEPAPATRPTQAAPPPAPPAPPTSAAPLPAPPKPGGTPTRAPTVTTPSGPAPTLAQLRRAIFSEDDLGDRWLEFDSGDMKEDHPAVYADFSGDGSEYLSIELHDARNGDPEFLALGLVEGEKLNGLTQASAPEYASGGARYRYQLDQNGKHLYGEVVGWRRGGVVAAIRYESEKADACVCDYGKRQDAKLAATFR
jgi:hypothetical protein